MAPVCRRPRRRRASVCKGARGQRSAAWSRSAIARSRRRSRARRSGVFSPACTLRSPCRRSNGGRRGSCVRGPASIVRMTAAISSDFGVGTVTNVAPSCSASYCSTRSSTSDMTMTGRRLQRSRARSTRCSPLYSCSRTSVSSSEGRAAAIADLPSLNVCATVTSNPTDDSVDRTNRRFPRWGSTTSAEATAISPTLGWLAMGALSTFVREASDARRFDRRPWLSCDFCLRLGGFADGERKCVSPEGYGRRPHKHGAYWLQYTSKTA